MDAFNTLAETWDENPNRLRYAQAISGYIKTKTVKKQRLEALEIGAGTGMLSLLLSDTFARIDMLDASEGMVAQMTHKLAAQNLYHLSPVASELQAYTPLKLYDAVYSTLFLHHVKVVPEALKKISDLTAAGGKLYLCDLYTEDGRFHPSTAEGVYHHGFDPDNVANDLKDLGYAINNIQTVYNFEKNDHFYPMFLIEATKSL